MEKYAYYAGVYGEIFYPLPPAEILAECPYVILYNHGGTQYLIFTKQKYYHNTENKLVLPTSEKYNLYILVNDEWVYSKSYNDDGQWGSSALLWSNHDIHNGSVDSGDLFFKAKELTLKESDLFNELTTHYFIKKDTLTELADIARTKSGTTDTKTIEEMKNIFAG